MTSKVKSIVCTAVLLLPLTLSLVWVQPAHGATYTVTFTADNATAGSLRWAITQANASAGPHTIAFNVPRSDPGFYSENATHGWWVFRINSALPSVTRAGVTIDGTTQTTNQGDTNPGQVGTGGTVGTDTIPLPRYDRPEIEITPATVSTVNSGLTVSGASFTARGMALYGFGSSGASITNAQIRLSGGTNQVVESCLIGVRANGSDPGFDSRSSGISIAGTATGTIRNNYIGQNIMGIYFNNVANWVITGDEIFNNALRYSSYDGLDMASGTRSITVSGNLIRSSGGTGIDSYKAAGSFAIQNNTILASGLAGGIEKAGIRLYGSNSQVTSNRISGNPGAGILVPPAAGTMYSANNAISMNSCYANGALGIDLIREGNSDYTGDGVNFNDGVYINTWGNRGIDYPVLTAATLAGNWLNLSGYVGTVDDTPVFANCTLEFFTAAPDPTGYGEGKTYLGSCMTGVDNSFTCAIDVSGKGLLATDSVTGTTRDALGNTSEFGHCRQLTTVDNPDLTLNITPPPHGYAGHNETYSGSVRNISDNSTAYNNVLSWQLPPEYTYVSSSGGTYDPITRTVSIAMPQISAGQEITGWITVNISASVPDATVVTTGSQLRWQNQLGNPLGPVNHSSSITVYRTPQLTSQLFPPANAFAGENVIYNGILDNFSSGNAISTVLVFQLPAGMSFVSATRSAIVTADNVTFNLGNLPPDAHMSGSMTVKIADTVPDGTELTLTTLLSWYDAAGNYYGPQERNYDLVVYQRPQLTITKEGPDTAIINTDYTFTGTLTNVGGSPAMNVTLVDYLPVGLTFVGSSHSAVYNPADRTVTWLPGTLNKGSSIPGWITVHVDNATANGSHLINNFQVTWSDNLSNPYGPESASKEITAYRSPQLTITKEGPAEATVGSYITFTGTLTNVGGLPAGNVVLVDLLPSGLTYISSSHGAVYNPANRTVTWNLGSVGSGVSMPGWITVQVDSNVPNGTHLVNTFSVTWRDAGGQSYGPATAVTEVIARTNPLLHIVKSGPEYGRPGSTLTFNISVSNFGGLEARNVTLVDALPDKYAYVSSIPSGSPSAGNVIWNLGSLASGATSSVSLTVRVDNSTANATPLANIASVAWKDTSGNSYGPVGTSFTTTIYSTPFLTILKTGPATANPGDNCTYQIQLTNQSDAGAFNVILMDIVPLRMAYVSSSDGGVYDGVTGMVSWPPFTLNGVSQRSFSVTLRVDPSLTEQTRMTDTAMASWKDVLDNEYGPATGTCTTAINPFPTLAITIAGPASVQSGAGATFTLRVTNTSATMASASTTVQYIMPTGLTFNSASQGGTYAGGVVTWNIGALAPGASREVSVSVTFSTAPVGSSVISTGACAWQYPAGTVHGPVFSTLETRVEAAPPPPPPPPPEPRPVQPQPAPHSSATIGIVNNPPPMPLPYIYIKTAGILSTSVQSGEPVQITATVHNKGTVNGTARIRVYVNSREEAAEGVSLSSGQSMAMSFTLAGREPGIYTVYVNDVCAGTYKVSGNIGEEVVLVLSMSCVLVSAVLGIIYLYRKKYGYY